MKTKEALKKLTQLQQDNPDLPIKFFVDNETICDDYRYTEQYIANVEVSDWIEHCDVIYTDEDEAKDTIRNDVLFDHKLEDEELDKKVDAYYTENVKTTILVTLSA